MSTTWTVGSYLTRRLEQAGVGHIFGVPGDYCLQLFDSLEAGELGVVGTCNELDAGYAADGYARLNGVGAVAVTYDVGGFSLLNAVAGAYAERVPVIVVSGAPRSTEVKQMHVLHHSTGDLAVQYNVYRNVTALAVRLAEATKAPAQIDEAVAAALLHRRPAYIEVPLDLVTMRCRAPGDFTPSVPVGSDPGALHEAVAEAAAMLERAAADRQSAAVCPAVIMAGVEAHRLGITRELLELVEHLGCPFVTTIHGKSVLPETHPQFAGIYIGALGRPAAHDAVAGAQVVLSLGNLMSDIDLGLYTTQIDPSTLITANSDRVRIGYHVYDRVELGDFVESLLRRLPPRLFTPGAPVAGSRTAGAPAGAAQPGTAAVAPSVPVPEAPMTVKRFYDRVQSIIGPGSIVLADAGDSFFSAAELTVPDDGFFLCQAFYTSIGWTVPATLGAKCAAPRSRPVTFVGDGAFQMTAQELSTIVRLHQNPVVFVMNNEGYTVERFIHDGPYNDINVWRYSRLAEVFGGPPGLLVRTEGELEAALDHIRTHPDELALVEVQVDRLDASETLKRFGRFDR